MKRVMAMLVGIVLAWTTIGFAAPSVALAIGGSISGLVTDSSGNPIVGATVRASTDEFGFGASPPVTTDSNGYYSIVDLPANASPWKAAAGAPGF